jgi:hypothetical protein
VRVALWLVDGVGVFVGDSVAVDVLLRLVEGVPVCVGVSVGVSVRVPV